MNHFFKEFKNLKEEQRGMVMVTSLILMTILTSIGIAGIYLSTSDMKIAHNYKRSMQKFYTAEAALERGINTLDRTPINEWGDLLADANNPLDPDNPFVFTVLSDSNALLQNEEIGGINYTIWVRNNYDDLSNDACLNGDEILVVLSEAIGNGGIPKRIESAIQWTAIKDGDYGGKNMDSENSGTVTASIDWDPNST